MTSKAVTLRFDHASPADRETLLSKQRSNNNNLIDVLPGCNHLPARRNMSVIAQPEYRICDAL